jgi:UDP-glucuronate decarboxylase
VIRLTGSKSKIVKMPLPADDPMMRKPDISLANKELNWNPNTQLEEGLLKTIEFFKTVI